MPNVMGVQVDSKKELERALKAGCEAFIMGATKLAVDDMLSFITKVTAVRVAASSKPLREQVGPLLWRAQQLCGRVAHVQTVVHVNFADCCALQNLPGVRHSGRVRWLAAIPPLTCMTALRFSLRRLRIQLAVAGVCLAHTAGGDGDTGEDSDGGAASGSRGEDEAVHGELRCKHSHAACASNRCMLRSFCTGHELIASVQSS
jgi:hypothetical protein